MDAVVFLGIDGGVERNGVRTGGRLDGVAEVEPGGCVLLGHGDGFLEYWWGGWRHVATKGNRTSWYVELVE